MWKLVQNATGKQKANGVRHRSLNLARIANAS